MTTTEWLALARQHADDLRALLRDYHPVNRQPGTRRATAKEPGDFITAPTTEEACVRVRQEIRKNFEGDPVVEFDRALVEGNIGVVYKLLSDAWFGVPESTTCWRIPGFKQAVDLMDDPPDDDEDTDG